MKFEFLQKSPKWLLFCNVPLHVTNRYLSCSYSNPAMHIFNRTARMQYRKLVFALLLAAPLVAIASGPFDDHSKAGPDGPYVLYRGQKIVVKSVEMRDTQAVAKIQVYDQKTIITLQCQGPDPEDEFSFQLKTALLYFFELS